MVTYLIRASIQVTVPRREYNVLDRRSVVLTDCELLSRRKRKLALLAEGCRILSVVLDPILVRGHVGCSRGGTQSAGCSVRVEVGLDVGRVALLLRFLQAKINQHKSDFIMVCGHEDRGKWRTIACSIVARR